MNIFGRLAGFHCLVDVFRRKAIYMSEKRLYSRIKKARWVLLQNYDKLSDEKAKNLNEILSAHSDLALCYAMKEELIQLFQITDVGEAHSK